MSDVTKEKQSIISNTHKQPAKDILYDFNQAYQRYSNTMHVFDDGTKMTSVEAHTLKHICQNEGITLTDIVNYWGRTKGTVSAQITNLENKGYVYRKRCEINPKKTHIFPTEEGRRVNERHVRYDIKNTSEFLDKWFEEYTMEDMKKLTEYMEFYIDVAFNKK